MHIRQAASLTEWTKSSYSAVNGDCVEIKLKDQSLVAVRDSKAHHRPPLGFTAETWSAFITGISRKG
ncbi:DUF397 domain-containing protein [Streptomyces tirandamycinicus]|uniref:DUF397 domain-containing protein n=1 Tax=Streptomyces tirandamycinicus TaxID=2174846 RepID=A0A2S1ST70_9ACTN|nr:DUF397 domain-containing protein [Streptomyces tirandamycinicus]AWI29578.1 DUF397 domain-containing protein [Streptomyces tirandamycinicus]